MHPWTPEGRAFPMGPLSSRNFMCLVEMEKMKNKLASWRKKAANT